MDLRDELLLCLSAAGFDRVGCLPIAEAGDPRIQTFIENGFHGDMGYLARHAGIKETPARKFVKYRSILVGACEYGNVENPSSDPSIGNISRYALGTDYHTILRRMLRDAANRISASHPKILTRPFVDSDPINEKLVASRAGLGFVGKHTNLISPTTGSYFFLGLLLVSVELERTGPVEPDRCGVCSACIPACPTGAIIAPYQLDARLCISYLTIEFRGIVPKPLRSMLGNRIFGCDDCQEVCPWNRFAARDPKEPFRPRSAFRTRPLSEWLELDAAGFAKTFEDSAVLRAGHEGFLRNCLIAAGNARDRAALTAVNRFLTSPSSVIRAHAVWALRQIAPEWTPEKLRALRERECDPEVQKEFEDASPTPTPG